MVEITKKNYKNYLGENSSRLSEKDRRLVRDFLLEEKNNKKKKDIDRTEEYMDFKSGKKDEGYSVMEVAKGGMIKGYKHGGSVKAGRLAKRGYGAAKK